MEPKRHVGISGTVHGRARCRQSNRVAASSRTSRVDSPPAAALVSGLFSQTTAKELPMIAAPRHRLGSRARARLFRPRADPTLFARSAQGGRARRRHTLLPDGKQIAFSPPSRTTPRIGTRPSCTGQGNTGRMRQLTRAPLGVRRVGLPMASRSPSWRRTRPAGTGVAHAHGRRRRARLTRSRRTCSTIRGVRMVRSRARPRTRSRRRRQPIPRTVTQAQDIFLRSAVRPQQSGSRRSPMRAPSA